MKQPVMKSPVWVSRYNGAIVGKRKGNLSMPSSCTSHSCWRCSALVRAGIPLSNQNPIWQCVTPSCRAAGDFYEQRNVWERVNQAPDSREEALLQLRLFHPNYIRNRQNSSWVDARIWFLTLAAPCVGSHRTRNRTHKVQVVHRIVSSFFLYFNQFVFINI